MSKYSEYIIAITILVQSLLLITINNEIIAVDNLAGLQHAVPYINVFIIAICLFSLVSIQKTGKYRETKLKTLMMKRHLNQVEEIIKALQGEKHQYARHLQTIQALVELGRLEEASSYLDELTADSAPPYNKHYTDHIALSVMLNRKMLEAEKRGIEVDLTVTSDLSALDISSGDICSIIENLVDNALEAAIKDPHPRVRIELSQDNECFSAEIFNNGAALPQGVDVFTAGFSTKTQGLHGFGLYVVRQLLDKYRGQIEIDSEAGTNVTVKIPLMEIYAHEKPVPADCL